MNEFLRKQVHYLRDLLRAFRYQLSGYGLFQNITALLQEKTVEEALHYLKKKYWFHKPPNARCLIEVYQYINRKIQISSTDNQKKKFIIHIPCWGEAYAEKCLNFLIPSLLAKNNLPRISNEYDLQIILHCEKTFKEKLESHEICAELSKYGQIIYLIIPNAAITAYNHSLTDKKQKYLQENSQLRYLILGALQHHVFEYALECKCCISFLQPDLVFSDSFYKFVLEQRNKHVLFLSTTLCVNANVIKKQMFQFYNNKALEIPSVSLNQLMIDNIHLASQQRIVSEKTVDFQVTAQLIFATKKGYIIRALHYHPIMIDCEFLTHSYKTTYLPIDGICENLIDLERSIEEQVYIFDNSSTASWIELSDPGFRCMNKNRKLTIPEIKNLIINEWNGKPQFFRGSLRKLLFANRFLVAGTAASNLMENDIEFCKILNKNIKLNPVSTQ